MPSNRWPQLLLVANASLLLSVLDSPLAAQASPPSSGRATAFQASVPFSPNVEVNLATGNLHLEVLTARFARGTRTPMHGLSLHWNSRAVTTPDCSRFGLGAGWSSSLGGGLYLVDMAQPRATLADGTVRSFHATGTGKWRTTSVPMLELASLSNGWSVTDTRQWRWLYDQAGLLTEIQDASGNAYLIQALAGLPVGATDPVGRQFQFARDALGRLDSISDPSGGGVWECTHDAQGRLQTITDPTYGGVTFGYDVRGRVCSFTDWSGANWLVTYYDATAWLDRVHKVVDPLGQETEFVYDVNTLGRTRCTDVAGRAWFAVHDALDPPALLAQEDPLGRTWNFTTDGARRVTSIVEPTLRTWTYTYDANGNLLTSTDPRPATVVRTYDAHNNMISVTSGAATTQYLYGDPAHPTKITQCIQQLYGTHTATTTYTWFGAVDGTPAGIWNGCLASITDAGGVVTRFEYDAKAAQVAVLEGPAAAVGRIEKRWDFPGSPHFVDHGTMPADPQVPLLPALPALMATRPALSGQGTKTWRGSPGTETWTWLAPPASAAASTLQRSFLYDGLGRESSALFTTDEPLEPLPVNGVTLPRFAFGASHADTQDQQPTVFTLPGGATVTETHAANGLVAQVAANLGGGGAGFRQTISRDADGRVTGVAHDDGSAVAWMYGPNGIVERITHLRGTAEILRIDYTYNARLLPTSRTETDAAGVKLTTWAYDLGGRLRREDRESPGAPEAADVFTYDDAGNRRTRSRHLARQLQDVETYFYDSDAPAVHGTKNHRLVRVDRHNAVGSLQSSLFVLYENPFGHASRLVRRLVGSTTVTATVLLYADDGSPWLSWDESWTDDPAGPVGLVRTKVVETRQVRGEGRLWRRLDPVSFAPLGDATWSFAVGPVVAAFQVATNDGSVTLQALRVGGSELRANGTVQHMLPDLVGSARCIVAGVATHEQRFTAFGESLSTMTTLPDGGYVGTLGVRQAIDGQPCSSSGILAMGHRWYSPELGRFVMRDPIGVRGGVNVYAYCKNAPTCLVDPAGLAAHGSIYPYNPRRLPPFPEMPELPGPPAPQVYGPPTPIHLLDGPSVPSEDLYGPPVGPPVPGDSNFIGPLEPGTRPQV